MFAAKKTNLSFGHFMFIFYITKQFFFQIDSRIIELSCTNTTDQDINEPANVIYKNKLLERRQVFATSRPQT